LKPRLNERIDDLLAFGVYALSALMLARLYFSTAIPWSAADYLAYISDGGPYPLFTATFRFRILVPSIARLLVNATGASPGLVLQGMTAAFAFALLIAYRRYLSRFMRASHAAVLAPLIVYAMMWNYVLLNRMYFPFDFPSVLFFVLGCLFIHERKWVPFYLTLLAAALNRDTSYLLSFVFFVSLLGEMPVRRMIVHLAAQAALLTGLRLLLAAVLEVEGAGAAGIYLSSGHPALNVQTILNMLRFQGNAAKDWTKFLLGFGGLWWFVPRLIQGQPRFVRRSLLVVIPALAGVFVRGIIDEMRIYGELVPVIVTPVAIYISRRLDDGVLRDRIPNAPSEVRS
jgi:hypothetical protein